MTVLTRSLPVPTADERDPHEKALARLLHYGPAPEEATRFLAGDRVIAVFGRGTVTAIRYGRLRDGRPIRWLAAVRYLDDDGWDVPYWVEQRDLATVAG